MKKLLITIALIVFTFSNSALAGITSKNAGKGPLKVSKDIADILEYYFSGGTMGRYAEKQEYVWKPGLIVISIDGTEFSYFRHPIHVHNIDNKRYVALARVDCKKRSGQECFLFANGYKIVWDNGSNKKKRRLKKKDVKAGKTLQILQELGYYDGAQKLTNNTNKKTDKKIVKKKENNSIKSIALSWEGYDDLIIGTVGKHESDNGETLINFNLPNNDGNCEGSYLLQNGGMGSWQVACSNNIGAAGTLKWTNDGGVKGSGRDYKDKKVKFNIVINS
tara:strand:- start:1386 stop:2216 length:831 start_codon:yes stop_codon:yes gene_type:complete